MGSKKYKIIYADPPWKYNDRRDKHPRLCGGASVHYECMDYKGIAKLPIPDLCDDDTVLFMWATFPMLKEALFVGESWGFKYKTIGFNWVKLNKKNMKPFFGIGYYTKCLRGDSQVYIQSKSSKFVSRVSLEYLYRSVGEGWMPDFKIWTPDGWRDIINMAKNTNTYSVIDTPLGKVSASDNHKLFYKTRRRTGKKYHNSIECDTIERIAYLKNRAMDSTQGNTSLLFSTTPIESEDYKKVIDISHIGSHNKREIQRFELTEDLGWMLGLYAAEGNYSDGQTRFNLHRDEVKFVERLQSIITNLGFKKDRYFNLDMVANIHYNKNSKGCIVYFNKRSIAALIQRFIPHTNCKNMRLNLDLLLNTSIAFRTAFLQGFYDGDGIKASKYKSIVLCNEGLIADLRILYHSIGVPTTTDDLSDVKASKDPKTFPVFNLRMYNRQKRIEGTNYIPISIYSIDKKEEEETLYDLAVDGQVFIVDDIVSHNSNAEICLIFTRKKTLRPVSNSVSSIILSPREEHSKKPDEARDRIVQLYGDLPRIELFARKKYDGWDAFGNEIESDISLSSNEEEDGN